MGDDSVGLHFRDDEVAAAEGFVRIKERRKGGRAFGQAGEESGFSEGEVFGVLGEEILRGGLKAVQAVAEVDLVAVEGEDLLFGEGALDLDGEIGLLDFAGGGSLGGEKEDAGQLHGERGSALGAAVGADVVPGGADDAEDVDAPVGLEVLVFNGDDGLAEDGGEVVVADDVAVFEGEGADYVAFAVVEVGGGGGAIAFEVVDLGQVDGVDEGEAGERAGNDGQKQQHGERRAAGELAAAVRGNREGLAGGAGAGRAVRKAVVWGQPSYSASWASLRGGRRCLRFRLAFSRCKRMCWRAGVNHGGQEWGAGLQVTDCRLTDYGLQIKGYRLQITDGG